MGGVGNIGQARIGPAHIPLTETGKAGSSAPLPEPSTPQWQHSELFQHIATDKAQAGQQMAQMLGAAGVDEGHISKLLGENVDHTALQEAFQFLVAQQTSLLEAFPGTSGSYATLSPQPSVHASSSLQDPILSDTPDTIRNHMLPQAKDGPCAALAVMNGLSPSGWEKCVKEHTQNGNISYQVDGSPKGRSVHQWHFSQETVQEVATHIFGLAPNVSIDSSHLKAAALLCGYAASTAPSSSPIDTKAILNQLKEHQNPHAFSSFLGHTYQGLSQTASKENVQAQLSQHFDGATGLPLEGHGIVLGRSHHFLSVLAFNPKNETMMAYNQMTQQTESWTLDQYIQHAASPKEASLHFTTTPPA